MKDAAKGLADGTYKGGDYILADDVDALAGATQNVINGAKSTTVVDSVTKLTADTMTTKAVLALADNVTVEDTLQALALNTLPDFGKATKLVVTDAPKTGATVPLGTITVAEASGAQAKIDAFLARTDVDYTTYKVTKPTTLTAGSYSIEDTATAVKDADVNVLADAVKVSVADSMANISALASGTFAEVDSFTVKDTLANITGTSDALVDQILKVGGTLTATDTAAATATFTNTLLNTLQPASGTKTTIDLSSLTANNATLTIELDGDAKTETTLNFKDNNPFANLGKKVALEITGSEGKDVISLEGLKNGATIDGGLGADTITLGDGVDTVVLGTGITKATDYGTDSANVDTIKSFATGATGDKLDFDGLLADFGKEDYVNASLAAAEGGGNKLAGGEIAVIASEADNAAALTALFASDAADANKLLALATGKDAIIITKTGKVWYVLNDSTAEVEASEVFLVATLDVTDAPAGLSAENFA